MEIILTLVILIIVYALLFGNRSNKKTHDAIINTAVALGVPSDDAACILENDTEQLSSMLHACSFSSNVIKERPYHERMGRCIYVVYSKKQSLMSDVTGDRNYSTCIELDKLAYGTICDQLRAMSDRDTLKFYEIHLCSKNINWNEGIKHDEKFYISNSHIEHARELLDELRAIDGSSLSVQVIKRPLQDVADTFNNYYRHVSKDGFTIRDKETGHVLSARLFDGVFSGQVSMPDQGLSIQLASWKEGEYPFSDDFSYKGFENGFNPSGNWWFCIESDIRFSAIANLSVALRKNIKEAAAA
ncbi:hypothetical protein I3271_07190 [Photobacterium leiognathi]|uniref:hypothetical protein n=1 Tax=Photobacterium leiognathi TaxID=553611 RepID=UPI001EDE79AF|nr:hypothetical protein [Photobacterium leiognathi]MCG3884470.1 hypothetical protein [Photobacterium leiognathi]